METIPVPDLPKQKATAALQKYRKRYYQEEVSDETLNQVYDYVGGRLSFLNRVAKSQDMLQKCQEMLEHAEVEIQATDPLEMCNRAKKMYGTAILCTSTVPSQANTSYARL